jgi:predicted permease
VRPDVVPPPGRLPQPPRFARTLLRLLLHGDDRDAAISDLDEEFDARAHDHGRVAAARWYCAQVLRSMAPVVRRRWAARVRLPLANELRWAWRGVRGRGIGAVVYVALVAIAVGASTLAFAAADAFVFNRAPYPNADRVVLFERTTPIGVYSTLQPDEWLELRRRTDLIAGLYGHGNTNNGPVPADANGVTESVWIHQVSSGLFDALGVVPTFGRPLMAADGVPGATPVAVLASSLAARWFGEPRQALGQFIRTEAEAVQVVGVMPAAFRFPTNREEVWTTVRTDPDWAFGGMTVGLLAPGATPATAQEAIDSRGAGIGERPSPLGPIRVVPMPQASHDPRVRTNSGRFTGATAPALFTILFAAAICLTAVACLNLIGLELAAALTRAHVHAVQTSLGATRGLLLRTALCEALILTSAGAIAGYAGAVWGSVAVQSALPTVLDLMLLNQIDIDKRAAVFMTVAAVTAWLAACAPLVWFTSRSGLTNVLRRASRAVSVSRAHIAWRHGIVAVQTAATVLLLSGAAVFLRPYVSTLAADRRFDSAGLATINVASQADASRSREERDRASALLHEHVFATLSAHPAVRSVASISGVPPAVSRATPPSHLWIEGQAAPAGLIHMVFVNGSPGYLDTLGLRLLAGRALQSGDSPDRVVVDVELARRYWPDGNALGARYSRGTETAAGKSVSEIVGISSHLRPGRAWSGRPVFVVHTASPPGRLSYLVRLDVTTRLDDVAAAVRTAAPGARVSTSAIAAEYADIDGDTRIAVSLTSGFGALAFVVAIAGIYGVTAFVVGGRTREIGIRLALGATAAHIRRSIVGPILRVVGAGLAAGVGAALVASRWIETQPVGVTGASPATHLAIAVVLGIAALLAAWRPAREASRVNPAITLRAE